MNAKIIILLMTLGLSHVPIQFTYEDAAEENEDLNEINNTLSNDPRWTAMDADEKRATIEQHIDEFYRNKNDSDRFNTLTPEDRANIARNISAKLPERSEDDEWVIVDSPTHSDSSIGFRNSPMTEERVSISPTKGTARTTLPNVIKEQILTTSTQLTKELTNNMIAHNEDMPSSIKTWNVSLFNELITLQMDIKGNRLSPNVGQERLTTIISTAKGDIRSALTRNQAAPTESNLKTILNILNRY